MPESQNVTSVSLAWLLERIEHVDAATFARTGEKLRSNTAAESWRRLREEMHTRRLAITKDGLSLDSDVWLCKSSAIAHRRLVPIWSPPNAIDDFIPAANPEKLASWQYRETRHVVLDERIAAAARLTDEEALLRRSKALAYYRRAHELTQPPFVNPEQRPIILFLNQCLAWLHTAMGRPLVLLALANDGAEAIAAATIQYLDASAAASDSNFEEAQLLAAISNDQVSPAFANSAALGGQGEPWRERWGWLSQDTTAEEAERGLVTSAVLLANPAIIYPLLSAATLGDQASTSLALCSLRRIALTLRVIAWAEDALEATWDLVRPKDILCFAYGALRPELHRDIALSHRSTTVKPVLVKTRFWNAPDAAFDASWVPKRESNLAMIWGLFAAAPVIVRMASSEYRKSEWCARESEMLDHLLQRNDFLRHRVVVDAAETDTTRIDQLLGDAREASADSAEIVGIEFPPRVEVELLPLISPDVADLLCAACAVRFIAFAARGNAEQVDAAVIALCRGAYPDLECPTQNDGDWNAYISILQALDPTAKELSNSPIRLTEDYTPAVWQSEIQWFAKNSPDFRDSRNASLRDHLIACEWLRAARRASSAAWVVDCRGVSRNAWEGDSSRSLQRGMTSAATSIPLWFLQSAGARLDKWPALGDFRPILTETIPNQFSWMSIRPLTPWSMERYFLDAGLAFSKALTARYEERMTPRGGQASS